MGASSSFLGAGEAELLDQLASERPWPIDDDRWDTVIRLKQHPWLIDAAALTADFAPIAAKLLLNDAASHNLSTFAAQIAARLPRVGYFYRTEVEQTIAGVVRVGGGDRPAGGLRSRPPSA